ncbi:hypothetical protein OF83DRAFT_1089701, partial [Amylostereum chailletii]
MKHDVDAQATPAYHIPTRKPPPTPPILSPSSIFSSHWSPPIHFFESAPLIEPIRLGRTLSYKPPCAHFLRGECRFGDLCRFSHVATYENVEAPGSRVSLTPAIPKTPVFSICKFFKMGRCTRADCPFSHVGGHPAPAPQNDIQHVEPRKLGQQIEKPLPPLSSNDSPSVPAYDLSPQAVENDAENGEPPIEMILLGCKVSFGAGVSVRSITTAFESKTILVKNIPHNTSQEALLGLLEKFGHIVTFMREPQSDVARIEFVDSHQAAAAVEGLVDTTSDSSGLTAQFELSVVQTGSATFRSTKVKASWYAPSILAYAHYNTFTKARDAAQRLDAMVFEGATIRAVCQAPTFRQTKSFSVVIKGLPIA